MLEVLATSRDRPSWVEVVRFSKRYTIPASDPSVVDISHSRPGFQDFYEEITPNSEGSHKLWKSFEHYKKVLGATPVMTGTQVEVYRSSFNTCPYTAVLVDPYYRYYSTNFYGAPDRLDTTRVWSVPALYVKRSDGGFVPPPADLEALKQRSLNVMLPVIKAELSLLNSIIELKDFKSLPKTLLGISSFARKFLLTGKQTLREALRTGSDGYLQLKFNILPLLSDISGLRTAMLRNEKRINALVTRSGRSQSMHFCFNWAEYPDTSEVSGSSTIPTTPFDTNCQNSFQYKCFQTASFGRYVTYAPSSFHAQIEYNYNYTQYQLVHARALALLDAFGVNFNPVIIWNAIPWSFVVDWVAGVNRWLDQFKTLNMEPTINIHRYLWSVKRSRRILVTRTVGHGVYTVPLPASQSVPLPVVDESAYRRFVGLPSSSSIILSGLSSTEFSLGAALVFARRRHHRHG